MNKFEKRMKDELNSYTPDIKDKIKTKILQTENIQRKEVRPKSKVKWQFVLTPILAVVIIAIAVVIPLRAVNFDGNNGGGVAPKPPVVNKVSTKGIYTMSAVSGVAYLAADNKSFANAMADGEPDRGGITEDILEELKIYLGMFESMLVSNGFEYTAVKPTPEVDGKYADEYNIKISATIEGHSYTMYYNEKTADDVEIDADDDDDDITENTSLEGIMLYEGQIYTIEGSRTVETEEAEKEVTVEFRTWSMENPSNSVNVKQEIEGTEVSYKYSIYEDGKIISEKEIEWEEENGVYELGIEFEVDGVETEFEIKAINETRFDIEYQLNEQKYKIIATKTADGYSFSY